MTTKFSPLIKATCLTALVGITPLRAWAAGLPSLGNAQALDANNQPVTTTATLSGGYSVAGGVFMSGGNVNAGNSINIVGEITVDPNHVGQVADIVVYANFATLDDPANPTLLTLGENGAIGPWSSQPADLLAFMPQVTLSAMQRVEIYNNPLPEGKVQIFFGYLLDDALVITQQPIDIVTENMPEPIQTDTDAVEIIEADVPIDPSPMLLPEDDRLVGQLAYRWTNGATLKVGFDFSGANWSYRPAVCYRGMSNSACQEKLMESVISAASGWSQHGNIYFRRSNWQDADIRVQFQEKGGRMWEQWQNTLVVTKLR
jgi:hypothetical protein